MKVNEEYSVKAGLNIIDD